MEQAETCDTICNGTGRCDPSHPLHCCHLSITQRKWIGTGRMVLLFARCVKCGKRSRTATPVKAT
jgi:hypothetical protein